MHTKYIFVTGGVTSSLGKGIFSASLGRLLESRGQRVTIQKFDPYINVDPGTMNPYEHGEVYVTQDGAETDLDLGHYERFLGVPTSQANNVTTGRVYLNVITKEREGAYLGKTVQVVPHIIDEIKSWMVNLGSTGDYDVVITEIGGTVGDIESQPYLEAIRQLRYDLGPKNTLIAHLTLVPYLQAAGELKTKPTQHSVKTLLAHGLQPDLLLCRAEHALDLELRSKIARFCNVEPQAVIAAMDAETIYEVPLLLKEQELDTLVMEKLSIKPERSSIEHSLERWAKFVQRLKSPRSVVNIALVGKYVEHQDAYKSISESFILAGAVNNVIVEIKYILSDDLSQENVHEQIAGAAGILVAPGFGERGIEGKLAAVRYARENDIPFLGICLGMQCAIIEYARNVVGWSNAHSTEFNPDTPHPVIDIMEEQKKIVLKGGTMRLGGYDCHLTKGSRVHSIYKTTEVRERHRHRYEVNNELKEGLEKHGMRFTGMNQASNLVEIIELPQKKWFIGVQFHPEYQSVVDNPHPLFESFVAAAVEYARQNQMSDDTSGAEKVNPESLASSNV